MSTTPLVVSPQSGRNLFIVHKLLLVAMAALAIWLGGISTGAGLVSGVIAAYALLSGICYAFIYIAPARFRWVHLLSYAFDTALILYLIAITGALTSPFWPLLPLQALLPAFYAPYPWLSWAGAFASGILYVAVLRVDSGSFAFLVDPLFLARYGVIFFAAVAAALAADRLNQATRRESALQHQLATQAADLDAQAKGLQRTAGDLGDRVLQLRALQEVARALAATLDLPDTLAVLAERLAALTDAQHVGIALSEADGAHLVGVTGYGPAADRIRRFQIDLSQYSGTADLFTQGNLLDVSHTDGLGFRELYALWQADSIWCLPLVLRGRPLGAVYLGGFPPDANIERQHQLLDSFAYFAAAAIESARLYRAVADKSRELEAILVGIGDGVLVVDADLRLILMNPVAARIFALDAEPPTGVAAHLLLDSEELLFLLEEARQSPETALIREVDFSPAMGQRQRTYQALAAPLMVEGSLHGVATVLRDITTQKELERMKSNFLSVVSHELKTPMHSIKGFVDIILMGKTGPVSDLQRDFLETVKQQTNHLQRMIDDLLEFSRLESGRITLRLQPVDIPVVVEAALDKLAPLADAAGVALINQTREDIPTLAADPWRLEQVVTNLVDNAIKFTPAGGTVTIGAQDLGDFVQISVSDTGIGIPPAEVGRIFDRFYQVDSGANRQYKGTGLGLTICRHIVEHHGGRITCESSPGQGATFTFTISKYLELAEMGPLDFTTLPEERVSG